MVVDFGDAVLLGAGMAVGQVLVEIARSVFRLVNKANGI